MSCDCDSHSSFNEKSEIENNKITLKFPFTVNGKDRENLIESEVERITDHISFSLPYDLNLKIKNAKKISKENKNNTIIYIFKFEHLNFAIDWMNNKIVNVELEPSNGDVKAIEIKMNEFMKKYEKGEKINKKRQKVVDEDGFSYYI